MPLLPRCVLAWFRSRIEIYDLIVFQGKLILPAINFRINYSKIVTKFGTNDLGRNLHTYNYGLNLHGVIHSICVSKSIVEKYLVPF